MNIALTGASGSIGRELRPFLEGLGHSIYIISSSQPGNGKSVFSYADLEQAQIHCKIDALIHLASLNSNLSKDKIDQETNLTRNVLSAMQGLQCPKLIFFSTAKVYGDNSFSEVIFNEFSPMEPNCKYSEAKKRCEDLIISRSSSLNICSFILRLPPVLNQSYGSNLGKLIRLAKKGAYIPSLAAGDLNQRSFISQVNINLVINRLLETSDEAGSSIYNVADDHHISLNKLLRLHGNKGTLALPGLLEKLIFKTPFCKSILLKLYGNFILENHKLTNDLSVKLYSTQEAVLLGNSK